MTENGEQVREEPKRPASATIRQGACSRCRPTR
jgi:hypothetical protein